MTNTLLTPQTIAKEVLYHLENDLQIAKRVRTDVSSEFKKEGATVDIRRPQRFVGQKNNLNITGYRENIIEGALPMKIDQTVTVPFDIDALDMTLSITDERIQRYIKAAQITLNDGIETALGSLASSFYHIAGTAGTNPATPSDLSYARALMTSYGVPKQDDQCFGYHDPFVANSLSNFLATSHNSSRVDKAIADGNYIGKMGGFHNYESVHITPHTVGNYGGNGQVNGANQDTTYLLTKDTGEQTLVTDGWTNSATKLLRKGDVITINGVYGVNPVSKVTTGKLQTFVVKEDVDSDGAGNCTLTISPPMITSGGFQNVTAAPVDNASITVVTGSAGETYKQSLMVHKDAMALVTRPLLIDNSSFKTSSVVGNNIAITVSKGGNIDTLKTTHRLDMLFGTVAFPDYGAVRIIAESSSS